MPSTSLVRRVEVLEDQVSALSQLPERIASLESTVAALRGDVLGGFAEVDGKLIAHDGHFAAVYRKLAEHDEQFAAVHRKLAEHDEQFVAVHRKLAEHDEQFVAVHRKLAEHDDQFAAVRQEIRAGDEETRRQMRVLHEELLSRIALLQEGFNTKAKRRRRRE